MKEGSRKDKSVIERVRDATLLALTMEEGAVSQKIQVPSRAGKAKESDSPLEAAEEHNPFDTLI